MTILQKKKHKMQILKINYLVAMAEERFENAADIHRTAVKLNREIDYLLDKEIREHGDTSINTNY